jgi:NitT/TauT family transport system permease protein
MFNNRYSMSDRIDKITIGRFLVPFFILGGWELLSTIVGQTLLPGPVLTLQLIQGAVDAGWYVPNMLNTLATVGLAFAIAALGGFVTGVLLGTRDLAYELFEPFVLNTYAIPKIILFPIFLFIFQLGLDQKVAFGAFHGFFPMLIVTMSATRELPEIYLNVGRSLQLSGYKMARHVVLPFVLVQLVVGLRLAFSLSFLGVILAELFAAQSGIGLHLRNAMANAQHGDIMSIVTVLMVVAFIGNLTFYGAQQILENRWNLSAEATV